MLVPKNFTYKKVHKKKHALSFFQPKSSLLFGFFGIKALGFMRLDSKHLEILLYKLHKLTKKSKLWVRVNPSKSLTKQKEKSRMGKGVGSIDRWVCLIKPGQTLLEFNAPIKDAKLFLRICNITLPIKFKLFSGVYF
jgi:large subunit ribosomal protein L16